MPLFTRDRRKKAAASEIAAGLFQVFVKDNSLKPEDWEIPPELVVAFLEQSRLYLEATVSLLLCTTASKEKPYEEVLRQYDQLILPVEPTPDGLRKRDALMTAANELSRLLIPGEQGKMFTWAAEWFTKIGHEQ
jgi:hypothetical protein